MKQIIKLTAASTAILALCLAGGLSACGGAQDGETSQEQTPQTGPYQLRQTLYYGGDIITMEGDSPQYVDAVVEREGQIVYVGDMKGAMEKYSGKAREVNLAGKTMLPGFIDGHGHMVSAGTMGLVANVMPPPDGPGKDFDSLVKTTKDWAASKQGQYMIGKLGWIVANGYDDSQLTEQDHPTKEVLDRISTDLPVLFMHQSGHLGVVNSKALEMLNFTKDTPDPKEGVARRDKEGNPTGVMEEQAFFNMAGAAFAKMDADIGRESLKKAQALYAGFGYTTAQSGRTTADTTAVLEQAARDGSIYLDIVSYPDIRWNPGAVKPEFYNHEQRYNNGYRVGGVKLTLDGSPQGKTAWLTKPYHVPPTGRNADYVGYPIMDDETAKKFITQAYENKWQLICHTNGDAAIDPYIHVIRDVQKTHNYPDHRTTVIHGQTLRKDQIPDLVELGMLPSFYSAHTFYWGDWHVKSVLGHPRADYISPGRDAIDAGLTMTSHHDAPVIPPKAMRVLDAPINRVTRSGVVLGPDQRITPYEGLKTITEWAARQYFEEDTKGTLSEGKLADFVILEKNPLKVDPLTIHDIKVEMTIKEGETVFPLKK